MVTSSDMETGKDLLKSLLVVPDEMELEYVPTGNIGFDMVLSGGKGLPMGSSVLLWSEHGVGKSTLFVDAAKRLIQSHKALNKPFRVLYIDIEGGAFNLMRDMGMEQYRKSQDLIYYNKAVTWRQIGSICDAIVRGDKIYNEIKLIIIDSIGQVLSDQNVKNSIADGDFGTRSRERGNFYSKYFPLLRARGISTLLVSQARQNQEASGMYDPKTKAAAGWSDKHNVDIIIKCSAKQDSTFGAKEIIETACGSNKELNSYLLVMDPTAVGCKSREGNTHKTEVLLEKGKGINNFYILYLILKFHKLMSQAGAWYAFGPEMTELLGLADKKYKKREMIDILSSPENIGKIVGFLKEEGCYSMARSARVEYEDEDEGEEE